MSIPLITKSCQPHQMSKKLWRQAETFTIWVSNSITASFLGSPRCLKPFCRGQRRPTLCPYYENKKPKPSTQWHQESTKLKNISNIFTLIQPNGFFLVTQLALPKNIPLANDVLMERVILPYPRFSSHILPLQIQVLTILDL